jgi:hypothetical protein
VYLFVSRVLGAEHVRSIGAQSKSSDPCSANFTQPSERGSNRRRRRRRGGGLPETAATLCHSIGSVGITIFFSLFGSSPPFARLLLLALSFPLRWWLAFF